MQLTKPRPITEQEKPKRTIPFTLDYRSICE